MGIFWTVAPIREAAVVEFGCMGHNLYSGGLLRQSGIYEGYGAPLISALKTLARENFANLAPSPVLVKMEYSHPTLSNRIAAIERAMQKDQNRAAN